MQAIPSIMLYSQAVALLQQMQAAYIVGSLQSPTDIATSLNSVLTKYNQSAGQPILDFDYFEDGEPPISPKMNGIIGDIQLDVSILQNQIDVLNAATLFTNNLIVTQLLNLSNENSTISNQLDTLELFSSDNNSGNMIVFSDSFGNSKLVDHNFLDPSEQASITDGVLRLSPQGALTDLASKALVSILGTSNGFLGNNQEIEDPTLATINPINQQPLYEFVAQVYEANDLKALTDGNPTTWVEYEYYLLTAIDKTEADNLNFTYQIIPTDNSSDTITQIDWSIGPPSDLLELDLQFDLGSVQSFNYITYTPYGLSGNTNNPVLITQVTTSEDGTTWTPISPSNVWVGTNTTNSSLRSAQNYTIGTITWSFGQTNARYINMSIQQPNPITVNVGHLYYEDSNNVRQEGPVPTTQNPSQYYDPTYATVGGLTQYREYFIGKRWAIGIQDIGIQQVTYQTSSSMVTLPLAIPGIVNRIALDADVWIPPNFSSTQSWVNFFVSPDNGQNWFQLNNIEDSSLGYPAVIAFNDPLPSQFQDPNVQYYTVEGPVNSLRFKIELNSPNPQETPLVRSYSLKVTMQ